MSQMDELVTEPAEPRTFTEERRRQQCVEAAIELIARDGMDGASFSSIAERTGTSKGTVAYHFGSRDALLLAVVRAVYRSAGSAMAAASTRADPAAGLRSYIDLNLEWIAGHPAETIALITLRTSSVPVVRALCNDLERAAIDVLAAAIRDAHASSVAGGSGHDAAAIARALRGAIDAFGVGMVVSPDLDRDGYAATLRAIFLPGVRS